MYGSRTTFAIGATTKKGGLMFGQLTFFSYLRTPYEEMVSNI